ncbi:NAD(P)-binding protein [Rhizopogon vinicolor AM-OR11-026]|uniref:NAD(P)-binding protein n=1 Tax=Rhizopogon vinicolor AM-OR11-026 TaxID=1314800 RepID=A0A1B7MIE1_9AGAM|nr:NAD(P)-binding protein [Rhizopogon vinicolor AM-OR11-026]
MPVTWFLTGASRGIGLEITRQLLESSSNTVFASCRSPATAFDLDALKSSPGTLHIIQIDVMDEISIKAGCSKVLELLNGTGLDYVINNAAINHAGDLAFSFDPAALAETIQCNVTGPALVTRFLLPSIEKSSRKVIVNISSPLASIGRDLGPISTSYSISKTGLNMLTYKQSRERPDFIPILMDPGWVKTDMGGEGAKIEPHVSVTGILNVATKLTSADAGKFYTYLGKVNPW